MLHLRKFQLLAAAAALLLPCPTATSTDAEVAAATPGTAAASFVPNGDFETTDASGQWPAKWGRVKSGGTWQTEGSNHFLRLESTAPGTMVLLFEPINIPAGTSAVELNFRQRVTNLKVGKQKWFDARIMMDFKDAAGAKLPGGPSAGATGKDTDGWVQRSTRILLPENTAVLDLMPTLFQVESGTFDLDDITLTATDPAPLRANAVTQAAAKREKEQKNAATRQEKAASAMAQSAEGSLVSNGNFEADGKGVNWPDQWGHPKSGTWEQEEGNHFIRLTAPEPNVLNSLYRVIDLPAGTRALELSWRQRLSNLQVGASPWFDARIMLEYKDAAGKKLNEKPGPPYATRSTDGWVQKETKFLVPEGAVSLELMPALFQVKSGTFDIDDIVLKPTDPAPILEARKAAEAADKAAYVEPEAPNSARYPKELHVDGNHLADSDGKPIWLQGVNVGGMESLAQDKHAMKSMLVAVDDWKSNIVRLPVNETFWFGRSPYQKDGGASYRKLADDAIALAANRGAYVMLDLHRFRAPKAEHAEFWKDAATRYKNHPAVIFDLFNEPHDLSWEVWRNGGFVQEKKKGTDESAFLEGEEKAKANAGFESIGMQALVEAVRGTGAKNICVAGGLAWSGDLSGVTKGFALEDKTGNGIMYSWHNYNWHKDWAGRVLAAAAKYPIIVGEVGADPNKMNFIPLADQEDPYTWVPDMLGFIQKYKLNWTGWCLHPRATPVLISDWDYTPTPFWGVMAKDAISGKQFEMKRMR